MAYTKPRYLTEDEVQDIVAVIPRVKAATHEAADHSTNEIKIKIAYQLREQLLSPEMIPKLKNTIIQQFFRSRIDAGEPVGITAAEGVGGPATQMTLNTFHQTGGKNVGSGVDGVRETLNVSANRKIEFTTFHFNNKYLSFEDVLELRRVLVGVTVKDLLKTNPTIHDSFRTDPYGNKTYIPYTSRGWWYNTFFIITGKPAPQALNYARLVINKSRMYSLNLTPELIVKCIESKPGGALMCVYSPSTAVECIIDVYPNTEMMVTVLRDKSITSYEAHLSSITEENAAFLMIKLCFLTALDKYLIQGILGINQIFPKVESTSAIIRSCTKYLPQASPFGTVPQSPSFSTVSHASPISVASQYSPSGNTSPFGIESKSDENPERSGEPKRVLVPTSPERSGEPKRILFPTSPERSGEPKRILWSVWINMIELRTKGIPLFKLKRLIEVCGMTVISWPEYYDEGEGDIYSIRQKKRDVVREPLRFIVETLDDTKTPLEIIKDFVSADDQRISDEVEALKKSGVKFPVPSTTEVTKYGIYVSAESNGSNLSETLTHPLVDPRRTYSNNTVSINNILGIQGTSVFISKDFYDIIINSSAYCSPRHLFTIVAFMTAITLISITSRGAARWNRGAFADASFEHALEAFKKSALTGQWENTMATSTAIFLGLRGRFGTGCLQLGINTAVV
jgi:hypothetical protein